MAISPDNLEKLGPRLRVVCNGDEEVNGLRAQLSAAVEAKPTAAPAAAALEKLQQAVQAPTGRRTAAAHPRPINRRPTPCE